MSAGRRLACALLYVAASVLAFPQQLGERVLDLGLFLAWLPPVALLLAVRGLPLRRAAWLGFALGTLAHAVFWVGMNLIGLVALRGATGRLREAVDATEREAGPG
jgi:hypothetical protein